MCLTRYSLGHQYFMWYELHRESGALLLCRGYVRWASHERREYSMSATTAAASAQRESCSGRCPSQETGCVGSGNSRTLATSCEQLTHWKRLWCLEGLGQEEKGTTEDQMAGWHHWLDGHESEWTLGVGEGQGGLACCDSWGRKESDTTERLIWSDLILKYFILIIAMVNGIISLSR